MTVRFTLTPSQFEGGEAEYEGGSEDSEQWTIDFEGEDDGPAL